MTRAYDSRKLEEFSPEELLALTGLPLRYDLILSNFLDSGKDSKTYKIPESMNGGVLYTGLRFSIRRLKLENEIELSGHKFSKFKDSVTLTHKNRKQPNNLEHQKHNLFSCPAELDVLKVINSVSSKNSRPATIAEIAVALNRSSMYVYNKAAKIEERGLIKSSRGKGCSITNEGQKVLAALV